VLTTKGIINMRTFVASLFIAGLLAGCGDTGGGLSPDAASFQAACIVDKGAVNVSDKSPTGLMCVLPDGTKRYHDEGLRPIDPETIK
jgi:hypothetical protein